MPLHGCKLLRGVKVELNENHLRIAWIIKSTLNYWSSSCRVSRLAKDWEYPIKDLPIVKYREKKKKLSRNAPENRSPLRYSDEKKGKGKEKRLGAALKPSWSDVTHTTPHRGGRLLLIRKWFGEDGLILLRVRSMFVWVKEGRPCNLHYPDSLLLLY